MDISTFFLTLLVILATIYYTFFRRNNYFIEKGIPHIKPIPIFGNMLPVSLRRMSMQELLAYIYNSFPEAKYVGVYEFTNPIILIRDPELVNSIAVKNFDNFIDHRNFIDEKLDPLFGNMLFSLRGDKWREVRRILSPAFTSSKMKLMFDLIRECAESFANFVAEDSKEKGKIYDTKNIFGRYTTDVVATCAFGVQVDSMKDPNNDFFVLGGEATNLAGILSTKMFIGRNFPWLMRRFGIRLMGSKVTNFFTDVVSQTIKMRDETGFRRPDMIQLMMDSRGKNAEIPDLTIEEMTSQAFVFFFGGFDTSSLLMCFAAHQIAAHPEVKEKLRIEIENARGDPSYETIIQRMKYLDAVINETLRLYPIAGFLDRVCAQRCELPPSLPGHEPVTLEPGTCVYLLPYAMQRDPRYFDNPEKFDPDRFLNRSDILPPIYIPFGIGPRICIGNRFALMETKLLLFYLLLNCDLQLCEKTKHPIELNPKSMVMMPKNGFWLKIRDNRKKKTIHRGNGNIN